MKVLQVCAYTAQYGGNFIASLLALDELLCREGIETEYLFPETVKETAWCTALQKKRTVFFAGMNRFRHETFLQVQKAMRGADIIHSHFELYDCLCAMARKRGQRLFWHLHDSFDEEIDLPHRILNRLQYGVFGKRAILISPNRFYADYTVKLGFPKKNVWIVSNCIDCHRLHNAEPATEKQYDFFAYGGFYKIKGLDILLDACRILSEKGYDFTVGIVGYPDTWRYIDTNYPDLERRIVRKMPSENVREFYDSARLFLSTSRRECFSYALLEALYMKLPAICSDIVGSQWAHAFDSVAFFESGNAQALASQMERFLRKDHWFCSETLTETSNRIAQEYCSENWAEQIKEIYFGE